MNKNKPSKLYCWYNVKMDVCWKNRNLPPSHTARLVPSSVKKNSAHTYLGQVDHVGKLRMRALLPTLWLTYTHLKVKTHSPPRAAVQLAKFLFYVWSIPPLDRSAGFLRSDGAVLRCLGFALGLTHALSRPDKLQSSSLFHMVSVGLALPLLNWGYHCIGPVILWC